MDEKDKWWMDQWLDGIRKGWMNRKMYNLTVIDSWQIVNKPHFIADTAAPGEVWTWTIHLISFLASWIAEWMTYPALLIPNWVVPGSIMSPFKSTLTKFEAVTSE